jgi:putative membrane protein
MSSATSPALDTVDTAKPVDRGEMQVRLACERTWAAGERTLMAWIRTSLSMISFGFTIFKFFQYLHESTVGQTLIRPHGPRNLGLTLVVVGVVVLMPAMYQHRRSVMALNKISGQKHPMSFAFITACLLAFGGILIFFSLFLRSGPF